MILWLRKNYAVTHTITCVPIYLVVVSTAVKPHYYSHADNALNWLLTIARPSVVPLSNLNQGHRQGRQGKPCPPEIYKIRRAHVKRIYMESNLIKRMTNFGSLYCCFPSQKKLSAMPLTSALSEKHYNQHDVVQEIITHNFFYI